MHTLIYIHTHAHTHTYTQTLIHTRTHANTRTNSGSGVNKTRSAHAIKNNAPPPLSPPPAVLIQVWNSHYPTYTLSRGVLGRNHYFVNPRSAAVEIMTGKKIRPGTHPHASEQRQLLAPVKRPCSLSHEFQIYGFYFERKESKRK